MSNIAELANCPELSFIESMTLQETEEQLRELYTKYYREATGKEPEIGEADPLNLDCDNQGSAENPRHTKGYRHAGYTIYGY